MCADTLSISQYGGCRDDDQGHDDGKLHGIEDQCQERTVDDFGCGPECPGAQLKRRNNEAEENGQAANDDRCNGLDPR